MNRPISDALNKLATDPPAGRSVARVRDGRVPGGRAVTVISRAEWSALAARGVTTYEVGPLGGNTTVFLDRESAEAAADEYGGGTFIQWDGRTGHVVTTAEYEADLAAWSDRAEPREITGMAGLSPASLAMVAHSRLFQEAGHPSSAAG